MGDLVRFIILALSLVTMTSLAAADTNSGTRPALPPGYMMCPPISDLHKDTTKMIWYANGWKSFSPSFSTQISGFLGAQWQGVNVGNISCVYRGSENMSFPIILVYNRLVFMPSGGHWTQNLGGYVNCKSTSRQDCIFKPQPHAKSGNIYDQAGKLKGSSNQQEMGY